MNNKIKCKAVIFDLDGTLVDSSECIEKIWKIWCKQNGIDFDELIKVSHGRPTLETMREFLPDTTDEMGEWFLQQELDNTKELITIKGACGLVNKLPEDKWAIATSGVIELAAKRLRTAGLPIPKVFITADKVGNGKPHPESFLKAAEGLNVTPEDCVIFEDSGPGIIAALRAGAKVIAVNSTADSELRSKALIDVKDLSQLHIKVDGEYLIIVAVQYKVSYYLHKKLSKMKS